MHMALIFLVPGLFIVMGWLWRHGHYPRSRNAVFGYRTALSMQSDEAWKYAQEVYGRASWWGGWILLILFVVTIFCLRHLDVRVREVWVYFAVVQSMVGSLSLMAFCEYALKRKFGATRAVAGTDVANKHSRQYERVVIIACMASLAITSAIFIVIGWLSRRGMFAGSINGSCGYRTALSMQSQEAWDFAQAYFGQVSWWVGWTSLAVSVCVGAFLVWKMRRKWYFHLLMFALCLVQCAGTIAFSILPVENALKERFGESKSAHGHAVHK